MKSQQLWKESRFLSRNRKNGYININNYNISEVSEECKNVSNSRIRFMKSPASIWLNEKMVSIGSTRFETTRKEPT